MLAELLTLEQSAWIPRFPELWAEVQAMTPEEIALEIEKIDREKPFWDNSWLGEVDPYAWLNAPLSAK